MKGKGRQLQMSEKTLNRKKRKLEIKEDEKTGIGE